MFNIPLIDIDTQAESHRILNLYTRYMLKKFRFETISTIYSKNHFLWKILFSYKWSLNKG